MLKGRQLHRGKQLFRCGARRRGIARTKKKARRPKPPGVIVRSTLAIAIIKKFYNFDDENDALKK